MAWPVSRKVSKVETPPPLPSGGRMGWVPLALGWAEPVSGDLVGTSNLQPVGFPWMGFSWVELGNWVKTQALWIPTAPPALSDAISAWEETGEGAAPTAGGPVVCREFKVRAVSVLMRNREVRGH